MGSHRSPWRPLVAGVCLSALAACTGQLDSSGVAGPGLGLAGGSATGDGTSPITGPTTPGVSSQQGSGDFANGNFDSQKCLDRQLHPGAMPGLVRLTHRQYDFIVRDVLGVDAHAERDFVADQSFYGFDNNAENLAVPQNQVLRYRSTAEAVAADVASDLSVLQGSAPCVVSAQGTGCRDTLIETLLGRLLRRPLSDAEVSRYTQLFAAAADLYDEGDAFSRGVRLVLEAALQSPAFLYRAELRDTPLDGSVVALDSFEIAARLSLLLWQSAPDDTLWQRAEAGELTDPAAVEEETLRMLDDAKAARMMDDFHAQWLTFDKLHFAKDQGRFPGYDEASFRASAEAGLLAFTRHVALESEGSVADMYTLPVAFADDGLASVYPEAAGFSTPAAIDTDPSERAGLLMQAGFLAAHADSLDSSPIHRGAFITKRALCNPLGPLPGNVGELPARGGSIVTTRDQVEAKTSPDGCMACHKYINPAGFALEAFDSLGRTRELDNGEPVDATGTITLDGNDQSFDGAVEFAELLASSDTARRCYATELFRFSFARGEADDDVCLLSGADQQSQDGSGSIREVLVGFTTSRGFMFRAQQDTDT